MPNDVVICSVTGMALVQASGQTVFRLAKPSYGALNPLRRPVGDDDRGSWNRFDLPGEQTIYAASSPEGSYGELLGSLKKPQAVAASEFLDDVGDATMEELITEDWIAAGKRLAPYVIDINWLYEFRLYTLALPSQGSLVASEHSRSVAYLHGHIPAELWERGMRRVTVSDLRSEDRFVTTRLAEQLASARLATGDTAIGLGYGSKHGTDWDCWAVWLRGGIADRIVLDEECLVRPPAQNPDLTKVLETYSLVAE